MFKITQGKGYNVTFANGYVVSVQWGWGNYCDHRDNEPPGSGMFGNEYLAHQAKLGAQGSRTAEVAVINANDDFCGADLGILSDAVEGWCSPERVIQVMTEVAELEPIVQKFAYISDNVMFKSLTEDEVADFQKWARDNYEIGSEIKPIWHPVVQDECLLMNEEAGENQS